MAKKRGQGEGSIAKRDDGTWWARVSLGYDENGKRKRKAFYGKTRKEVQEKLTAALNAVNNAAYIEPSNMTVGIWVETWLKQYKKNSIKPNTFRCYWLCFEKHIKPNLGNYKLKDLRNDIVQKFVNDFVVRGHGAPTAGKAYSILHSALEQAVINELVPKNVAVKIKLPKHEKKGMRVLSSDEQAIFIELSKDSDLGEIFILNLATGLRIG